MASICAATRQAVSSSRPFCAARQPPSRRLVRSHAYIEQSVSVAVVQQAAAYAVVLAAEAAYTRSRLPESDKGRPDVTQVAIGVAGTAVATAGVASGVQFLVTPSLIIGFAVSAYMTYYAGKRIVDTSTDDGDWPGNKSWPATMTLISFFALNVFLQGLRAEL